MASFPGIVPDYGAIFIANRNTRHECFDRKLFGAPFSCFRFVKEIKDGMVLFLFQHETRKLYGVFQAIADGKLNIVPEAYKKSGQSYPSQVRFRVIWRCTPLSEDEFRGAIKDNYFAPYKFNFGLSKDQVQRLLSLFYSKKIIVQISLNQNKSNIKHSKSLNEEKHNGTGSKPTLEEGEVKNTVSGTLSHSTTASAASSFTGTLSLPLVKGLDHVIVSLGTPSSGLEDYIPFSSPDHDDLDETVTKFLEAVTLKENQSESAKGNGYEQLSLCEESILPNVFGPKDLNQGPVSDGYDKSSPVHEREKKPVVKGLYADTIDERKCVFSRLNFVAPPPVAKEIKGDLESPDDLMKKLQQFHNKWKKFPTRNEKQNKDRPLKSKASAFSRLTVAPEKAIDKKRKTKPWDKPISENIEMLPREKKRRHSVFHRLQNDRKKSQVVMTEDLSRAKKLVDPVVANPSNVKCGTCGCLVNNQIPSQKSSTGKEKGQSCEEGSTISEIKNADRDGVSPKDVVLINDNIVRVSPKTLLTYYRRRRHSSDSSVAKELKLSVVDGEDAEKQIVGAEEGVYVKPVLV